MGGTSFATYGIGSGGGGSTSFYQEAPSGAVDGSNTAFVLTYSPSANANVILWLNGIVQYQGTEYTISGKNITMATAPVVGQSLWAVYS